MLNPDSQKASNVEEFKEKKADTSKDTEAVIDDDNDTKKSKPNESNAQVMRVLQNPNAHTGNTNFSMAVLYFMK